MNKTISQIILVCMVLALLTVGIYIGLKIEDDNVADVINSEPEIVIYEDSEVCVVNSDNTQIKDIEVTYETYYKDCDHTISSKNMEFGTTIEKIIENIGDEYDTNEISENGIIFRKEITAYCPNHFKLKLVDGNVVIYQMITKDKEVIYKNMQIPESIIREELAIELKKGIKVDSLEELNSYIEDIES